MAWTAGRCEHCGPAAMLALRTASAPEATPRASGEVLVCDVCGAKGLPDSVWAYARHHGCPGAGRFTPRPSGEAARDASAGGSDA